MLRLLYAFVSLKVLLDALNLLSGPIQYTTAFEVADNFDELFSPILISLLRLEGGESEHDEHTAQSPGPSREPPTAATRRRDPHSSTMANIHGYSGYNYPVYRGLNSSIESHAYTSSLRILFHHRPASEAHTASLGCGGAPELFARKRYLDTWLQGAYT